MTASVVHLGSHNCCLHTHRQAMSKAHLRSDAFRVSLCSVTDILVLMQISLLNAEHNSQLMLLGARNLTLLADVLPTICSSIVRHGAVPVLCARLMTIEYIDLAEQSLQVCHTAVVVFRCTPLYSKYQLHAVLTCHCIHCCQLRDQKCHQQLQQLIVLKQHYLEAHVCEGQPYMRRTKSSSEAPVAVLAVNKHHMAGTWENPP